MTRSGKNSKFLYTIKGFLICLLPKFYYRYRLSGVLRKARIRPDFSYIMKRVNYYNRLALGAQLPSEASLVRDLNLLTHKKSKTYLFDTIEIARWFPDKFKWVTCFGDVNYFVPYPSIVKSRPISDKNQNSVLLKLVKVRHFIFIKDKLSFEDKLDRAIFRGDLTGKNNRVAFFRQFYGHPLCDLGEVTHRVTSNPLEWRRPKISLYAQLNYKFIIALEGNDVASNLKWIMSSNSLAVMPRPTCETWFMEGTLIPNYHYVEIKSDYSDLEERLNYYIFHTEEAKQIIDHAHEYIDQFRDKKRELIISLLVMNKYFKMTGQTD